MADRGTFRVETFKAIFGQTVRNRVCRQPQCGSHNSTQFPMTSLQLLNTLASGREPLVERNSNKPSQERQIRPSVAGRWDEPVEPPTHQARFVRCIRQAGSVPGRGI